MARAAAGRSQAAGASLKQLGEQSVPSDHPPPSGKCQLESCDQNPGYLEFGTKEISHLVTCLVYHILGNHGLWSFCVGNFFVGIGRAGCHRQ